MYKVLNPRGFRATEGEIERIGYIHSFIEYIFALQNDDSSIGSLIRSDMLMCFSPMLHS